MGMEMKSLKWEGNGTKNLFPHTSMHESLSMNESLYELALLESLSAPLLLSSTLTSVFGLGGFDMDKGSGG